MSWTSRLLGGIALALHLAAPVGAYTLTASTPDFGALCSAQHPLSKAPAGTPGGHRASDHVTHCALCGGAFAAAMPAPPVLALAVIAASTERAAPPALRHRATAAPAPLARGPPNLT